MIPLLLNLILSLLIGWILVPISLDTHKGNRLSGRSLFLSNGTTDLILRILTSIVLSLVTTFSLFNLLDYWNSNEILQVALILIFVYTITISLLYFAVIDFKLMEVPSIPALIFLSILFVLNILLLIILGKDFSVYLWNNLLFNPFSNIIMGIVFGSLTALIVLFTGHKGMGSGDIIFATALGLINGYPKGIVGLYIAIFSALVYGLVVAVQRKGIKNVRIPFIPFLIIGTIAAFLFGNVVFSGFLNITA